MSASSGQAQATTLSLSRGKADQGSSFEEPTPREAGEASFLQPFRGGKGIGSTRIPRPGRVAWPRFSLGGKGFRQLARPRCLEA
jgi:hypothetical protein